MHERIPVYFFQIWSAATTQHLIYLIGKKNSSTAFVETKIIVGAHSEMCAREFKKIGGCNCFIYI